MNATPDKPDLFAPTDRLGPAPVLPDSGSRTSFGTGAVRDAQPGKGHFADIPVCALEAIAKRFEDGSVKYARGNWMKGIPLSSYQNSLQRHMLKAAQGHTDEDHFGAMLWNAACWLWTEREIEAGRLPRSLDDLPFRWRTEKALGGHVFSEEEIQRETNHAQDLLNRKALDELRKKEKGRG